MKRTERKRKREREREREKGRRERHTHKSAPGYINRSRSHASVITHSIRSFDCACACAVFTDTPLRSASHIIGQPGELHASLT